MAGLEALEFRIERWDEADQHVIEIIAACSNVIVAKAAYQAALEMHPKANLTLSHRARIIARSRSGS